MNNLIASHNKIISLGCNCFMKIFMKNMKINQETHFFDWIGSSLWSILLFIQESHDAESANLAKLMNINNYQYTVPINVPNKPHSGEAMVTYMPYNMRFIHDFPVIPANSQKEKIINSSYFLVYQRKYRDRYKRFLNLLKTAKNNKILFIRLEENNEGRVINRQHQDMYEKSELEYLIEFTKLLKTLYGIQCDVIFISRTHENCYLSEHNIVVLNDPNTYKWDTCTEPYNNLFEKNIDLLSNLCN